MLSSGLYSRQHFYASYHRASDKNDKQEEVSTKVENESRKGDVKVLTIHIVYCIPFERKQNHMKQWLFSSVVHEAGMAC
jgi:hypothetical protein